MKKQTKTMSLKKQLMSAVSMMLAAAVALGSSTYAWFVNKSRAEVKEVLFQASAGKNLEIAGAVVEGAAHTNGTGKFAGQDEGDQVAQEKAGLLTYWSSVTPEIMGENSFTYPKYDATAANPLYMTPVSIDGADLKMTPSATTFYKNDAWDGNATTGGNAVGGYDTFTKVTNNNGKEYICAQLYFRASENMDVYLNKAEWDSYSGTSDATKTVTYPFITQYNPTGVDASMEANYKKQAEDMAKALRIAFVVDGETTPIVAAFAPSTDTFDTALYNTAKNHANITSDTPVKAIDASGNVDTFGTAVTDEVLKYALTDASAGTGTQAVPPTLTDKEKLFSITANTPKRVTIYIWLEGTDKECVNAISSYIAGVYLPFVGTVKNADGSVSTYSTGDGVTLLEDAGDEPAETVE